MNYFDFYILPSSTNETLKVAMAAAGIFQRPAVHLLVKRYDLISSLCGRVLVVCALCGFCASSSFACHMARAPSLNLRIAFFLRPQ